MNAVVPDEPVVPSANEPVAGPVAGPGTTVVVTGGTGGIGLASATALATTGARLVLLGRDRGRGARAEALVRAAAPSGAPPDALPRFVPVDLSSLTAVARAAEEVRRTLGRPDVVVANAGGLYTDRWQTVDGIEASLAMNLVSPVALVDRFTAPDRAGRPHRTRVVAVSSGVVHQVRPTRDDPQSTRRYSPMSAYGRTKLYGAAAMLALAREREDLDVVLVDPGGAATDMTAAMTWRTMPWFLRPMLPLMKVAQRRMSTEQASRSTVHAATDPAVPPGAWLGARGQVRPLPRALRDPALGDWTLRLARQQSTSIGSLDR